MLTKDIWELRDAVGLLRPMHVRGDDGCLHGLSDEQVQAAASTAKRLAIIAPAGSGKSTTIAARLRVLEAYGGLDGDCLAVCFARDAARSIGGKLRQVGSHGRAMTCHSLALHLLRVECETRTGLPADVVLVSADGTDGDAEANRQLKARMTGWVKTLKRSYPSSGMTLKRAREAIARLEVGGRASDDAERRLWHDYKRYLADQSRDDRIVTDYGLAVIRAARLVRDDRSRPVKIPVRYAQDLWGRKRPVAWRDRSLWAPRYAAVVVDEAQDINRYQRQLIESLAPDWLTLVGDVDQSIYGFQGGLPAWLESMPAKTMLTTNYRSTRAIVRVAAAVAGNQMVAADDASEGAPVLMYAADDEADEDAWVADEVQALIDAGVAPIPADERGIVILTRDSARGERLRRVLEARGLSTSVEYSTVHRYKGREKEAVFIVGCSEETWCRDDADDARRVLYVACSRARDYLRISYAGEEKINGQVHAVHPLYLLDGLPVTVSDGRVSDSRDLTEAMNPQVEESLAQLYDALGDRKTQADRIAGIYARLADDARRDGDDAKASRLAGRSSRMMGCASLARFARAVREDHGGREEQWTLDDADYCRVRTCNICNWRMSRRWWLTLGATHWWAMTVNGRRYHTDDSRRYQDPLLLTLTVPNVRPDQLKESIRMLGKAWRAMTRTVKPGAGTPPSVAAQWRLWHVALPGAWRTIEVTYNAATGMYHPHMHALILTANSYARAYHTDDPRREGVDWVRRGDGLYGSPYYRSTAEWARYWTRAVVAASGSAVTDDDLAVTGADDGLIVTAPNINGGQYLVDIRRTSAGAGDISEVTKYVSKDLELLPPGLSDEQEETRLETLDDALAHVHLHSVIGVYRTIMAKATAGTLMDWMASDPETADRLCMEDLIHRYRATIAGSQGWSVDATSTAAWDGMRYVERSRKTQDDDLDEDPFDDDDDEEW